MDFSLTTSQDLTLSYSLIRKMTRPDACLRWKTEELVPFGSLAHNRRGWRILERFPENLEIVRSPMPGDGNLVQIAGGTPSGGLKSVFPLN